MSGLLIFVLGGGVQTEQPVVPITEVEACQIEFTNSVDYSGLAGKWGGQIAVYDAVTNDTGQVVALNRRVIAGREHLLSRVRLDQFENCIRRWRLRGPDDVAISLRGGSIFAGFWIIDLIYRHEVFRLRVPVAPRAN